MVSENAYLIFRRISQRSTGPSRPIAFVSVLAFRAAAIKSIDYLLAALLHEDAV
jgi:hypothetical protein